ncbi:Enoyl reductase LovC [Beauveria bassiana]|nr:Enoyl reductase LovC [Beauveria bassiana]KAH8707888.1 Trans-enoyl reductase fsa3 [Beauveria bassiana]
MKGTKLGTAHHTQTAIVGNADAELVLSHAAPIPLVTDDVVLVQNRAVAVNPVDTKMVGPYATAGAIAGSDFAGVVEHEHGIHDSPAWQSSKAWAFPGTRCLRTLTRGWSSCMRA